MSKKQVGVAEFRLIVQATIDNQLVAAQRERSSRADYGKTATVNNYMYVSVKARDGRPAVLGLNREHLWGIVAPRMRLGSYMGHLAVVSRESEPEVLFRRWSFASGVNETIDTEKPILSSKFVHPTLDWARAPHFHPETLAGLGKLAATEERAVQKSMAQDAAAWQRLQADLEGLRLWHQSPMPNLRIQ